MMHKLLAILLLVGTFSAHAMPTRIIDGGTGQLLGANGVDVGGIFFDVQFLDGTCVGLFSGCDEASDFNFQIQSQAMAAAQALLDQVLLDVVAGSFDTDPDLTNGCNSPSRCRVLTPFGGNGSQVMAWTAVNEIGVSTDSLSNLTTTATFNISGDTYAVWTQQAAPVPVPATLLLLGLGLVGVARGRPQNA